VLTLLCFVPDEPPEDTFIEVAGNFESKEDLELLRAEFEIGCGPVRIVNTAIPGWSDHLAGDGIIFNYTFGFELMEKGIQPTYLLESGGFDYRGATPIGVMLSANKPHASQLMAASGFSCPASILLPPNRPLDDPDLLAPLAGSDLVVLKPAYEEASVGLRLLPNDIGEIAKAVLDLRPHIPGPVLLQQYIHGVDVTVPVIGYGQPHCLPALALHRLNAEPTTPFVFDAVLKRTKSGLEYRLAENWDPTVLAEIYAMAEAGFTLTAQRDYARLDCRVDSEGRCWFLEMTANPEVRPGKASFAVAARASNTTFADVLSLIVNRGVPDWRPGSPTIDMRPLHPYSSLCPSKGKWILFTFSPIHNVVLSAARPILGVGVGDTWGTDC
jgi:D-alanine-D-alanine ligase